MIPTLESDSLRTIHQVWAGRLGVEAAAFDVDGVVPVVWGGAPAASVVRLGGTTVVGAPKAALAALRDLAPQQLVDPAALIAALAGFGPELFGAARLAFADRRTITTSTRPPAREATRADLQAVTDALPPSERDECGLLEMDRWWVPEHRKHRLMAAAGYEIWDGWLAHVGVAVAPGHRGEGLGTAVASATIGDALSSGLVVQWRSGADNEASEALGRRLGAVALGEQVTVDLRG